MPQIDKPNNKMKKEAKRGASLVKTLTLRFGNLKPGDSGDWTEEHQGKVSFF